MFNDTHLMHRLANFLVLASILTVLAVMVFRLVHTPMFTLKQLRIAPAENTAFRYVSTQGVQSTVAGKLSGNFFTMDLRQVRDLIETAPWVRRVQVRRLWPDALVATIEEQTPLAFWNEDQMINTWGEPFSANQGELEDDAVLPQLTGPEQSEQLVVQRYAELARWFAPLDLSIREVTLSPRYAWKVTLSDGLHLNLGRDPAADAADLHGRSGALPFSERIERFVRVWPAVRQRLAGQTIRSVDLRYPNGFAMTQHHGANPARPNRTPSNLSLLEPRAPSSSANATL